MSDFHDYGRDEQEAQDADRDYEIEVARVMDDNERNDELQDRISRGEIAPWTAPTARRVR